MGSHDLAPQQGLIVKPYWMQHQSVICYSLIFMGFPTFLLWNISLANIVLYKRQWITFCPLVSPFNPPVKSVLFYQEHIILWNVSNSNLAQEAVKLKSSGVSVRWQ